MAEEPEDVGELSPSRPKPRQRKSSISDTLTKFTSNTFTRRRTATELPTSSEPTTSLDQQSRPPTESGIPRSTSFLNNFSPFASNKSSSSSVSGNENSHEAPIRRSRKISERLSQTPFFNLGNQRAPPAPPSPIIIHKETTVRVEQRSLMQPIQPEMPRSSTMGHIAHIQAMNSPQTPNYMRSTSSSAARRSSFAGSLISSRQRNEPMPTITSNQPPEPPTNQERTEPMRFPVRRESLRSPAVSKSNKSGHRLSFIPTSAAHSSTQGRGDILVSSPRRSNLPKHQPILALSASDMQDSGVDPEEVTEDFARIELQPTGSDESAEFSSLSNNDDGFREITDTTPMLDLSDPSQVHTAQSPNWWLGRYNSLSDQFRTQALPVRQSPLTSNPTSPYASPSPTSTAQESFNHPMNDDESRERRIFDHLHSSCMTDDATESLEEFIRMWAERGRRIREGNMKAGAKVREKKGWLEGLMGKKK